MHNKQSISAYTERFFLDSNYLILFNLFQKTLSVMEKVRVSVENYTLYALLVCMHHVCFSS